MNPQNPDPRPDPEALLKFAEAEAVAFSRGKLKIFLGYSAGVGKTYAMLEAVRRLCRDGADIVVGYVETHKRAETQALIEGLEVIPRKKLPYRNTVLEEMDLDAVIRRRPKAAVVDELAHTNAPGSRHTKRFQDIEEMLSQGIDVYTTLNIQHLESLNDVITKVTGVLMRETVPDRILDEAYEIEVVDIPIGELLKRLKEGRIYLPEAAERAVENFFSESNLTALRELTLRRAAKRVDTQMQGFLQRRVSGGPMPVGERILVCVSPYPSSMELVRSGKLLAAGLDAEWLVVHVETPGQVRLGTQRKEQLARTLKLAEELGAKVVTLSGEIPANEVIGYARRHNVTKILIGKPLKRKLHDIVFGTVVDQLIQRSGEIDVYVINRSSAWQDDKKYPRDEKRSNWTVYCYGFILVAAASAFGALTRSFFEPANLVMYYLAAVVASAVFFGRGPSIVTAIAGVIAFDFLFVPPFFTFAVSDTQYLFTFFVLLAVSLVISTLTGRVRDQADSARSRESRTASLYELSRDLAGGGDREAVIRSLVKHVRETVGAETAVFSEVKGALSLHTKSPSFPANDHETAVADWVYRNGQPAGWGTDTLPGAIGYYLPIKTNRETYGVLGVLFQSKGAKLQIDDRRTFESFAGQTAVALERIIFSEEAQKSRILEEKDKLQSALFNSISHDLRTPLVSITGALSGMLEDPDMDSGSRRELVATAHEEADRLNRLVGNLLDMARLEAGAIKIVPRPCEIQDVVGAALKELNDRLEGRKVTVTFKEGLPHIPMDFGLMMKVLINLIDNAVKYAPFGLPIDIDVREESGHVEIRVLDRGLGIPAGDLEQVFGKFYRVNRPQNFEGTGLGLSICKGIVEAHHGRIWAENRPGGGTIITVSLSLPAGGRR